MPRKKVTRQKPVHLDHVRRENDTRDCLRGNNLTFPNGSTEDDSFKDIENTLNSYPIIYVNEDQNGFSLKADDNWKVNRTEGDYVTLIVGSGDISNVSSATNAKDSFSDSGRGSDFTNGFKNSDDGYNEVDDVYVTLCSDNIVKWDIFSEGERNSGTRDEDDIRNNSDTCSLFPLDSHYVCGNLSAKAIIEPLSPKAKSQPYLNPEPFSDAESSVSAELHRQEYLRQLREFEQSIDGAVWRRKLRKMENKRDDHELVPTEGAVIPDTGECSESITSGGKTPQPEANDIKTPETGSDDKVSLEDIIQDFLQYFQTKRHSVKTNHGSTNDGDSEVSENVDTKIDENLQNKLKHDLSTAEKGKTFSYLFI